MIKYYLATPLGMFEPTFARKTPGSSGFDLHANIGTPRSIGVGRRFTINTGLHIAMPLGIEAHVRPRSGLCRDHGVMAFFGSIDSDYRGEIAVTLVNLGNEAHTIIPGDRVAQLVFVPVIIPGETPYCPLLENHPTIERVMSLDELGTTERGASGFGSTGR